MNIRTFVAILSRNLQYDFPKMRGGSKAVWNFSENSSVLVVPSVPKDQTHSSDTDRHWQTGRQTLSAVIFQSGNYLFKKSDFGPAFNDLSSFWKLLLNFLNVVFVFRLELDKDTGNRCTASPGENMVTPRRWTWSHQGEEDVERSLHLLASAQAVSWLW